jgi:hypothetical protein
MTTATVTTYCEVNDPTREVVVLTVSSGETYVSRKFGTVTSALATFNEASGVTATDFYVGFSGSTVTITNAGVTDKLMTLELTGRK